MAPKITLLVDGKNSSHLAQNILKEANVPFTKVYGHGVNLPKAHFNNVSYKGVAGIQLLAKSLRE